MEHKLTIYDLYVLLLVTIIGIRFISCRIDQLRLGEVFLLGLEASHVLFDLDNVLLYLVYGDVVTTQLNVVLNDFVQLFLFSLVGLRAESFVKQAVFVLGVASRGLRRLW